MVLLSHWQMRRFFWFLWWELGSWAPGSKCHDIVGAPYDWLPLKFLNFRLLCTQLPEIFKYCLGFPPLAGSHVVVPWVFALGLPVLTCLSTQGEQFALCLLSFWSRRSYWYFLVCSVFYLLGWSGNFQAHTYGTKNQSLLFYHFKYYLLNRCNPIWDLGPHRKLNLGVQGMWRTKEAIVRSF